jgi:hypothetical protein
MVRARGCSFRGWIAGFTVAAVLCWYCSGQAAESSSSGGRALLADYPAIKTQLEKNQFGTPIYLKSEEKDSFLHADVYGIFNYPFDVVRDALQLPGTWCEITPLHTNIKACIFMQESDSWLLTLYSGHKHYQSPQDAYKLDLVFNVVARQPEYLDITMRADRGPLLTTDHRIRLEAVPLEKGKTFVHFRYGFHYGLLARMAMKTYFATIARDKVGFSSAATDNGGRPVHVGGVRGAIERNAVRYYLALQAYLEVLNASGDERFEKQISRWYTLTEKFPRQLHELGREDYLAAKHREHGNQLMLQKDVDAQ